MGRYTYILCCTILQIKAGNVLKGIVRAMDAYNYLVRTRMIRADLISLSFNATVTLKKYKSANFHESNAGNYIWERQNSENLP